MKFVVGLIAALLLSLTISGCLVGGGSRPQATVTVHDRAPTLLPGSQQQVAGSGSSTNQQSVPVVPGDGTFRVGLDVQPGTYRSDGSDGCYWARLKGLSGSTNDIIANSAAPGPQVVEIAPTDVAFKSSNCASWEMTSSAGAAIPSNSPVTAGPAPNAGPAVAPAQRAALPANAQLCPATSGPSGSFSRSAAGSPTTSCPFAEQVRLAYVASGPPNASPRQIRAYSPVTGQFYDVTCAASGSVATCTGGDFAIVYIF